MNSPGRFASARRLGLVLVSLALVAYMGYLLAGLYGSRQELQRSALARVILDTDKRAAALGYFFSERVSDLEDLAGSRDLQAYFENEALGMSMEYGLGASLDGARGALASFRDKKRLGTGAIYSRVVFLDARGRRLLGAQAAEAAPRKGEERGWRTYVDPAERQVRFHAEPEGSLVLALPYRFKGVYRGCLLAWIPTEAIHRHFVGEETVPRSQAFLLFGKQRVLQGGGRPAPGRDPYGLAVAAKEVVHPG